ncbi:ribbon-helix-helix protein, copG family [Andreesenia angusta]|uniref:Ribbon-helix-helix protein, copG family n=1 Tax=Andreesenia angusta TaxID=39480 RepID=A0A1S1V3T6_9FIRM|nr:DUF6290 family protein [Andreesenia angusta]OHW61272.1 ribbon-helix-helix protein, copG family [Andreesenia angusta]
MAVITVRVDNEDNDLIREYAKVKNMTVSELVRESVIQKIEDEIDMESYRDYIANKEDTKFYSLDEVEKELGL